MPFRRHLEKPTHLLAIRKMLLYAVLTYLLSGASAECLGTHEKFKSGQSTDVMGAMLFLHDDDKQSQKLQNEMGIASWNYQSNLTDENKEIMLKMAEKAAEFSKAEWGKVTKFAWKELSPGNETLYRWFKDLSVLGIAALPIDEFNEVQAIVADMQDVYGKAKVCALNTSASCELSLEPELTEILIKSRDYEELKHIWSQWRDVSGKKIKDKFLRYVEISNEAACLNGFRDAGDIWREAYESETFEKDVEELWQTLKPFYEQLHAYVRRKLIEENPRGGIKHDGPIPAHLLGNMWGQTWSNIFDIVKPFPTKKSPDVTQTMKKKKMTPLGMFKMAEEFFTSIGLKKMTPEFWNRSIIEKPNDREMICHASAWDFYDGKDFRIKMCTRVNMEDLITIHHEMGHIQYYQQYAHQPAIFRNGANPGFHEAVGDTMALSASTPGHLKKIGLLNEDADDEEADINSLLQTALDKIAFLPFGYLIDAWRWRVFDGTISKHDLNRKWWEMRLKYQGLCPPVRRSENDFDAGAKYHVAADVPYIRYFVSYVVQFQFHKALCDAADHKGPLHKCDIYHNKNAGRLLSDMLSKGSSVHWEKAMNIITNGKTSKMDARPMIEYFNPLMKWLQKQNENETLGWKSHDPMICP